MRSYVLVHMDITWYLIICSYGEYRNVLDSCYGKDVLRIIFLVFNKLHSGKPFSLAERERHW